MKHMVMGDKQSKEEEELVSIQRFEEEEDEEDGYFSGYAHFSIHHDMLAVIQSPTYPFGKIYIILLEILGQTENR